MRLKTLRQIKNLKNKKVLVRVGFDCLHHLQRSDLYRHDLSRGEQKIIA